MIYPLEVVVILLPLLEATVRRRAGLLHRDDLIGSTSSSAVAISGTAVTDSRLRATRGARVGWLLAIEGHLDRLRSASVPIALLPIGIRVDPTRVTNIEEPLLEFARKTGAGW